MTFFAHSANRAGSPWELLKDHSLCVAQRAAGYARSFGAQHEAEIAGLLHDLGEYSDLFAKRLKGEVCGLDHWTAGTIVALEIFRDKAVAAALGIQGHHIGLQEGSAPAIWVGCDISKLSNPDTHPLGLTLTEPHLKSLRERFESHGLTIPPPPTKSLYDFSALPGAAMLDVRMLFSTLVDADYIETEAHFEGRADGTKVYRPEGPPLRAAQAMEIVMEHLNELERNTRSSNNVQSMRKNLLHACLIKAGGLTNVSTLTAPTGAGKTLAMLAFAFKCVIRAMLATHSNGSCPPIPTDVVH